MKEQANFCRMYMKVSVVSDLTNARGDMIPGNRTMASTNDNKVAYHPTTTKLILGNIPKAPATGLHMRQYDSTKQISTNSLTISTGTMATGALPHSPPILQDQQASLLH